MQIIHIFAAANGGIAQLARAFDWQSKGQGFDSPYLHLENRALQNIVGLYFCTRNLPTTLRIWNYYTNIFLKKCTRGCLKSPRITRISRISVYFFAHFIFFYTFVENFNRMKNIFLLFVLAAAICSCSGNKNKSDFPVFELDQLLAVAEQELENTITVVGYVTHTCKHSGKRCFIIGESQKATMRVEAEGDIGGFSAELVGSKLAITGVVQERRLSEEFIAQMEKDVHHMRFQKK